MTEQTPVSSSLEQNSSGEFTVFGRPWCGYCSGALNLLDQMGLDYSYIDIRDQQISKEELGNKLGRPVFTLPQILHGDEYVGGYRELVPYLRNL